MYGLAIVYHFYGFLCCYFNNASLVAPLAEGRGQVKGEGAVVVFSLFSILQFSKKRKPAFKRAFLFSLLSPACLFLCLLSVASHV